MRFIIVIMERFDRLLRSENAAKTDKAKLKAWLGGARYDYDVVEYIAKREGFFPKLADAYKSKGTQARYLYEYYRSVYDDLVVGSNRTADLEHFIADHFERMYLEGSFRGLYWARVEAGASNEVCLGDFSEGLRYRISWIPVNVTTVYQSGETSGARSTVGWIVESLFG